ncbi:sensor histidine kinase [Bdellovibrio sp. BCCA]|uniref:sensor histidine kinase n=1 Tax=Bdellovibrio sp. BCCA TaxID=3136281 RepID=UPI0030F15101
MGPNFQFIFESSPGIDLILLPDSPRFTIVAATDAVLEITMTKREDIIGKSLFEAFPENPNESNADGMRNLRMSLNRVIAKQGPDAMAVQKYDIRLPPVTGNYQVRYWSPSNTPLFENGVLKYIYHHVVDVTDFVLNNHFPSKDPNQEFKECIERMERDIVKRGKDLQLANEKLRDAIQLREDVLAIVSHDLNNPLGSIQMSAELLKDSLTESGHKEQLELVQIIERSVRYMKRLIDDLLCFAKIQSGNFTVELKPTNLKKLVEEGLHSVHHHVVKTKIHIKTNIEVSKEDILCDHDRITEVLSNILSNAIKFSPPGRLVTLSAREEQDDIHFSIKDEGKGIAPEHLPHLFDRYWQAKETAKYGSGLGLAIAKGIVTSHGGKIWVESTLDHGTTVHFSIPQKMIWTGLADTSPNKEKYLS